MAPKRNPKGGSSATAGAGRSGVVNPASYTDYDDAMEDGVELEEKGERFQFGSKAQRFYEQAGQLYFRAAALASSSSQVADALYNASRIHYLLGTQFYLAPQHIVSVVESIHASSQALAKLNHSPPRPQQGLDEEPQLVDPFLLDVISARATAYQTLAELLEEVGAWPSEQLRHRVGTSAFPAEDDDELSRAGQLQTPMKLWYTAYQAFEEVAVAQRAILVDQRSAEVSEMADQGSPPAPEDEANMSMSAERATSDDNNVYGYTSSLVTTVSLIESKLSSLVCLTSLLQSARSADSADEWQARAADNIAMVQTWVQNGNDLPTITDVKESAEKEQEILRAQLALSTTTIAKAFELHARGQTSSDSDGLASQLQTTMDSVHDWANRLLTPKGGQSTAKADVATLCDVGEAAQTLCRLALRFLVVNNSNDGSAQAVWTLATLSAKLYSSALSALDTSAGSGTSAVLGQTNTSTPTSRARCRVLLALSTLSIFRSNVLFEQCEVQGAIGTRAKLVDNARLYARKAMTEIGLSSLLQPSPSARTPLSTASSTPPPGGWDSLTLQAEVLFVLLRSLLHRYKAAIPISGTPTLSPPPPALEHELSACLANLAQLQRAPLPVPTGGASMDLAYWLYGKGLTTFVDQIVDENGTQTCQEEITWWQEVHAKLATVTA